MKKFFLFLFLILPACHSPSIYFPQGQNEVLVDVNSLLKKGPHFNEEGFEMVPLGKSAQYSAHLVWIKDQEKPHLHQAHEGTIFLLQGKGVLHLENQKIHLKPGDIASIPQNTPHFFVNESASPVAAYVLFAPPLENRDYVPVSAF